MLDIDRWGIVNSYRRLIEQGKASDFICAHCGEPAVVMRGKDEEPWVHCFYCGSSMRPNQQWYDRMYALIKEFNVG